MENESKTPLLIGIGTIGISSLWFFAQKTKKNTPVVGQKAENKNNNTGNVQFPYSLPNSPTINPQNTNDILIQMNEQLSPNFTLTELTITNTGLPNIPTLKEIIALKLLCEKVLEPLRSYLRSSWSNDCVIRVTSGFRSYEVNKKVGGAATSQHPKGEAADIHAYSASKGRLPLKKLLEYLLNSKIPFDQIIDESKLGEWLHVSYKKYPRGEYRRVTVDSKGNKQYPLVRKVNF